MPASRTVTRVAKGRRPAAGLRIAGALIPAGVLCVLVVASCAPKRVVVIAPALDAEQVALALEDHTSLTEPIRVEFRWELNEAGVRVDGRGIARIEPPYKARLDLFLSNGETLVSAALVNGDLRLPYGMRGDFLPPPDLMWGALGVFRPEFGIELLGGDRLEGDGLRLRYRYGDGAQLHFTLAEGALRSLELLNGASVVQRVEVRLDATGRYPASAIYRNLAEFRELRLTREGVEPVEPFPPDIWDPNR